MCNVARIQYEEAFGQKMSDKSWDEVANLYMDSNLDWNVFLRLSVACPDALKAIVLKNRVISDLKELIYVIYKREAIPADVEEFASAAIDRIVGHFSFERER